MRVIGLQLGARGVRRLWHHPGTLLGLTPPKLAGIRARPLHLVGYEEEPE